MNSLKIAKYIWMSSLDLRWRQHRLLHGFLMMADNRLLPEPLLTKIIYASLWPLGTFVAADEMAPVVVTLFSNMIHEQNTSNTNLTNKAYPGYCKDVLCWRPPEKALAYLAGGNHLHKFIFILALVFTVMVAIGIPVWRRQAMGGGI